MAVESKIEADYLVVGAGALAMAFVDSVLQHGDAQVVMVDRRDRPGGHWVDAYPFVQLHQPSRFYGVDSTPLGQDRVRPDGSDEGFDDRATGTEICSYYGQIMRDRFVASGRIRFFPMCDYLGDRRFRSLLTGATTEVEVRRRVVDATYVASLVPATEPPPFEVAESVRCVPVGELTKLRSTPDGYVVIGGGKTAFDAVCWLLDQGCDPDAITWVRPREAWLTNRAFTQPGQPRTLAGVVHAFEAIAASSSVEEAYDRLEADQVMLRVDRSIPPTMMRGATLSVRELEQLRRVTNVVRLGHVRRIDEDQIVLDHGAVATSPGRLYVNCTARGLADTPPKAVFTDDTITLQMVNRVAMTLSAALVGFLETTDRTTAEKNALCRPTGLPHTPFDYLRAIMAGVGTELTWAAAPDLQEWLDHSRLNLLCGLPENPVVEELQGRFLAGIFPALARIEEFALAASPAERGRMYEEAEPVTT